MNELTAVQNMELATNAAHVSKEIVMKTAVQIKDKKYVKIEGWQGIALAHGCTLSAHNIVKHETGISAVGYVKRMSDGAIISEAEGFVGFEEKMWGTRDEYAQRAMAQTRAMSRAARPAFAHVVIMIDENLSTTPAEEVPMDGFEKSGHEKTVKPAEKIESPIKLSEGDEVPKKYWKLSNEQRKLSLPGNCYPKKIGESWIVTQKGH
jgi:hypothetical protein